MLPILRNAVVGLRGVDRAVTESAQRIGHEQAAPAHEDRASAGLAGEIDMYWEYTGTCWIVHLNHTTPIPTAREQWLAVKKEDAANGITWLSPGSLNNTYAIAVREEAVASLANLKDALRPRQVEAEGRNHLRQQRVLQPGRRPARRGEVPRSWIPDHLQGGGRGQDLQLRRRLRHRPHRGPRIRGAGRRQAVLPGLQRCVERAYVRLPALSEARQDVQADRWSSPTT